MFGKKDSQSEKKEQEVDSTDNVQTGDAHTAEDEKRQDKQDQSDSLEPETPEAQCRRLKVELAEYKEKYVRLFAEFDNARKRAERERFEFVKYANEGLLVDFLNILDDLERSVAAAKEKHEDYSAFLKGIEMVMAHVYELLKKNDVTPIESAGKPFDPNCHEALMLDDSGEHEEGIIVEEFQKGYCIADKVVRTAKVKVAKAAGGEQVGTEDTDKDDN